MAFRGRDQDHQAAGLSASEDESDLEVCHAHHAPAPTTPPRPLRPSAALQH